jgi:hypothetical protein
MRAFEFARFTRLNIYRAQLFEVSAEARRGADRNMGRPP